MILSRLRDMNMMGLLRLKEAKFYGPMLEGNRAVYLRPKLPKACTHVRYKVKGLKFFKFLLRLAIKGNER